MICKSQSWPTPIGKPPFPEEEHETFKPHPQRDTAVQFHLYEIWLETLLFQKVAALLRNAYKKKKKLLQTPAFHKLSKKKLIQTSNLGQPFHLETRSSASRSHQNKANLMSPQN